MKVNQEFPQNGKIYVEIIETNQMNIYCHDDSLPIIARNYLENGESKNLWYEQVLPAETVLYTVIQEDGDKLANALNYSNDKRNMIQIGANATIGYGFCKFELL